jgi:hypothetical protein
MAQLTKAQLTKAQIAKARPVSTRGYVALMLLTAGALLLLGQLVPLAGDALCLVLGIELLVWAYAARDSALLVTGGVVTGVGAGVVLAAGPLLGADPIAIGSAFVLSVAAGFALIAALSLLWWRTRMYWSWITAAGVAAIGVSLSGYATWALPAVLLGCGAAATVGWLRS